MRTAPPPPRRPAPRPGSRSARPSPANAKRRASPLPSGPVPPMNPITMANQSSRATRGCGDARPGRPATQPFVTAAPSPTAPGAAPRGRPRGPGRHRTAPTAGTPRRTPSPLPASRCPSRSAGFVAEGLAKASKPRFVAAYAADLLLLAAILLDNHQPLTPPGPLASTRSSVAPMSAARRAASVSNVRTAPLCTIYSTGCRPAHATAGHSVFRRRGLPRPPARSAIIRAVS